MIRRVEIHFSEQAKLLLEHMPYVDKEDLVDWFANERKITIGGGDICDYLKFKKKVMGV